MLGVTILSLSINIEASSSSHHATACSCMHGPRVTVTTGPRTGTVHASPRSHTTTASSRENRYKPTKTSVFPRSAFKTLAQLACNSLYHSVSFLQENFLLSLNSFSFSWSYSCAASYVNVGTYNWRTPVRGKCCGCPLTGTFLSHHRNVEFIICCGAFRRSAIDCSKDWRRFEASREQVRKCIEFGLIGRSTTDKEDGTGRTSGIGRWNWRNESTYKR